MHDSDKEILWKGWHVTYKSQNESFPAAASIAQWLEHWSCKPGVASSILAGGYFLKFVLSREI